MRAKSFLSAIFFLAIVCAGLDFPCLAAAHGQELVGRRVAVLITEGFHDTETTDPMDHLSDLGAAVTVIGPEVGTVQAYNSSVQVEIEKAVADVSIEDFDGLIIPGGNSPGNLRTNATVVDFVRDFFNTGKLVAAICHGPQVLVTADVLEGRVATSWPDISNELRSAGAIFVNQPVVIDGNLITSRMPEDLQVFRESIAAELVWARKILGHWIVNQSAGTRAYNNIQGGGDGLFVDMDQQNWIGGWPGGLSFDGQESHLELEGSLGPFVHGFTVSFWASPDQLASHATFIDLAGQAEYDNIKLGTDAQGSDLILSVYDQSQGSNLVAQDAVEPGKWQFFAAAVDAQGNARLYKDGQIVAQGQMNPPAGEFRTVNYIGASSLDDQGNYAGLLRDVRVFNFAMNSDELQSLFSIDRELIHHWPMDDQADWIIEDDLSRSAIQDRSGSDNGAFIKTSDRQLHRDMVLFGQDPSPSGTEASIRLGGPLDRAELGDVSPQMRDFTISWWFKMDRFRARNMRSDIMSAGDKKNQWSVYLWGDPDFLDSNDGMPRLDFAHNSYGSFNIAQAIEENKWYHVMLVRDANYGFRIYVNDELAHSGQNVNRFDNADDQLGLWLGNMPGRNVAFDGWVDDVRIYNYAVDGMADLTGTGQIDVDDLQIFLSYWLQDDCGACGGADLNLDLRVDFTDMAMMAQQWLDKTY